MARTIIAQIKLEQRNEIKAQILNEISNISETDINKTIYENITDLENLKIENALLKDLNTALKDKNQLLTEKNQQLSETIMNNNKNNIVNSTVTNKFTYSQAVKQEVPKQSQVRFPKIIIKKKDNKDNMDLRKTVTHYLIKKKSIQIKKLHDKQKENEMIIECMNDTSAIETEKILKDKLSNCCKIEKEELNKPRLKIIGVDNYENMTSKMLENDINERNFKDILPGCKVLHKYQNTKTKQESIIIEVTSDIYKKVRENKNRIFVGYQNCKVYDEINLKPCFNCGRYGHNGNKCRNDKVCLKCSESHNSINCNKTGELCCVNCVFHNNKFNTNYDVQHVANDSHCCQVLKNKIKKYIEMTDYPTNPTIPRFIGKIDIVPSLTPKITKSTSVLSLSSPLSMTAHKRRQEA